MGPRTAWLAASSRHSATSASLPALTAVPRRSRSSSAVSAASHGLPCARLYSAVYRSRAARRASKNPGVKQRQPLSRRDRGALLELGRENVSAEALAFDHRPKKNKKTKRGRKPDWKKAAYYTAKYAAKANACDYLLDH